MRLAPTRLFLAEAGCLYPFRPDVNPPSEPENAAMRRGKEIHKAIEDGINDGVEPTLPEAREAYRWQKARGAGDREPELVLGFDPRNGWIKEFDGRLDVPADWMPVIVDLVIHDATNDHRPTFVEVWDWKSGSPFSNFDYGPQVRANAFAVGKFFGAEKVTTGLAYVSASGVKPKSWTRDVFDFAEDKAKLRMWAEKAPTAEPVENATCRYCPVGKANMCPAKAKAA